MCSNALCALSCSVVVVQFEESSISVSEAAGTVEVCLLKEGVTSRNVTVVVIAQELTTSNSASGKCVQLVLSCSSESNKCTYLKILQSCIIIIARRFDECFNLAPWRSV